MYEQIMMQDKLTLFFPLQVKNKLNDKAQFAGYSYIGCSHKQFWLTETRLAESRQSKLNYMSTGCKSWTKEGLQIYENWTKTEAKPKKLNLQRSMKANNKFKKGSLLNDYVTPPPLDRGGSGQWTHTEPIAYII